MSQRPYTNQHADMYTCIRIYVNTLTLSFTNVLSNIYRYTRCAFCAYEHTHTLMVHTPAAIVSRRLRESAASARGPFVFGRQSHSWIGELLLFFFSASTAHAKCSAVIDSAGGRDQYWVCTRIYYISRR